MYLRAAAPKIFSRSRAWLQHEELAMLLYKSAVFRF